MSLGDATAPRPPTAVIRRPSVALAAIAAAAALVVAACLGIGLLSLPGLALGGAAAATIAALVVTLAPGTLVAVLPAVLPFGPVALFYPYQYLLAGLTILLGLKALNVRARWMLRLDPIEVANLALILWALYTGFWCEDTMWYFRGVRRMLTGLVAFAVAYRVARFVPRSRFDLGLTAGAFLLAAAALVRYLTTGLSVEAASLRRADTTDLGWGTANYIATLLLLLMPLVLNSALHARERWMRVLAWPTVVLVGVLQVVVASRAATVLFVLGTIAQLVGVRTRRHVMATVAVLAGLVGLLVSPIGQSFLLRFTSLRELGSMTVRIWYFRVAWRRVLDHFPFGMGLAQGWTYPDRLFGRDPHNYWLVLAGELGILGVVGWLIVLVLVWRAIGALVRDPEWQDAGRALQIAFWVGQLHTLVEPTYQGPQYQFLWFWVIGGYLGYHAASRLPRGPVVSLRDPVPLDAAHASARASSLR